MLLLGFVGSVTWVSALRAEKVGRISFEKVDLRTDLIGQVAGV
jgi:hypothetical protein